MLAAWDISSRICPFPPNPGETMTHANSHAPAVQACGCSQPRAAQPCPCGCLDSGPCPCREGGSCGCGCTAPAP